jgi:aspartate aminotransferase
MPSPKSAIGLKFNAHPRLAGLEASATLAINERSQRLVAEGRRIFRFGLGQSPFPVPDPVVKALQANAHQKDYLPVRGLLPLREAVAAWFRRRYGLTFQAQNILIAPGSKELLFLIQMALDTVLILPSPSWVSYHPQSRLAGNSTLWIETREADDWMLRPEALLAACREKLAGKTGVLLLNYPNNPTGATFTSEQLKLLAEAARELGILVLSDEIYGEVDHRHNHHSIASHYPEGTIVTTGLSKWCGAGGWRLGVAAFPEGLASLVDVIANIASETYTSTSAPIQYAAITAFSEDPAIDTYLDDCCRILTFVQAWVRESLLNSGVSVPEGTGGFYHFLNFETHRQVLSARGITDSATLCESLLEETGIALLPGTAFGRPANELTVRLSYVDFDGAQALQQLALIEGDQEQAKEVLFPRILEAMQVFSAWVQALD